MGKATGDLLSQLKRLNADRNPRYWDDRTRGQAPHKPFMLLSVADGIEQGWIPDNRIELSQELIETFRLYWNGVMGEDRVTTIALPFFHMQSEPFWELRYRPGARPYTTSPSLGGLRSRAAHAEMASELFEMMRDAGGRKLIRRVLLDHYFSPDTAAKITGLIDFNYHSYEYAHQLDGLAAGPFLIDHSGEEEVPCRTVEQPVRDAGFSYRVRKAYDYTCAVCRSRLVTPDGATLVDGAHILPFHRYHNDDPRNGLSLCKNHHWMLDHEAISIDTDYLIHVADWVYNGDNRAEVTMHLNGRPILLPEDERLNPAREALEWLYA